MTTGSQEGRRRGGGERTIERERTGEFCFKRSMNLSFSLFCTCWGTLGTSLRFDPQHTHLTIPDSLLSFSFRVQTYVTDVCRWTSNVTHMNSHDLPDNSLGALTCTQLPEKERKKKREQSVASGQGLEAHQTGDTAAAFSIQVPSW